MMASDVELRTVSQEREETQPIQAIIAYDDPYVQPLILSALNHVFAEGTFDILLKLAQTSSGSSEREKGLQIVPYEEIDFDYASSHQKSFLINSYVIRKALIRKHYLSTTVDHWVAKRPTSVLKKHFRRSEAFEVDYAEFLEDALVEAFDLRESLDRNAVVASSERQWWILKPGMSDRGQGIRLFSTMEELQAIFDKWDENFPDSDEEDESEDEDGGEGGRQDERGGERDAEGDETVRSAAKLREEGEAGDYDITTSHLRHFVAQPYIHPPLLLEGDKRKFHIRTYVLCAGSLKVYVYRPMLALFAAAPYTAPWESPHDAESFLTNTCLQESSSSSSLRSGGPVVRAFWDLPISPEARDDIFSQICDVTGEIFEAAAQAMPVHFQPLPNAFEVFGLDFLVEDTGVASLLEINAFPDFKQTGEGLEEIVGGFWKAVMRYGVAPFFGLEGSRVVERGQGEGKMAKAREVNMGRR